MKPLLHSIALFLLAGGGAPGQLPVSGRPVTHAADGTEIPYFTSAQPASIDSRIRALMENNAIDAGVVGINRGGRTIYLRSFGWLEKPGAVHPAGIHLPETAMFRIASVSKLITAAAVHSMQAENLFGAAGLNRKVFFLSGNDGMLFVPPPGVIWDSDFANVTISHLLGHRGGFRRSDDPYNNIRKVANERGVDSPPSVFEIMRWRLGNPLADVPGAPRATPATATIASSSAANPTVFTTSAPHGLQTSDAVTISNHAGAVPEIKADRDYHVTVLSSDTFTIPVHVTTAGVGGTVTENTDPYSNFGFNVLGQIVETAPGGGDNFTRSRVFGPSNWIPASDWARGRTFPANRHPREPYYQSTLDNELWDDIYDNSGPPYDKVPPPYGGFSLETGYWGGGMLASAQALLQFGTLYQVGYNEPAPGVIHNAGSRIGSGGAIRSIGTSGVTGGSSTTSLITTTTPHGYSAGQTVRISGHVGSVPDINGVHTISSVADGHGFRIPVTVTMAGTGGTAEYNPPLTNGHTGGFAGISTILQRDVCGTPGTDDDLLVFIAFTKSSPSGAGYETLAYNEVMAVLNTIPSNRWPDAECDGFWVKSGSNGTSGRGGYHDEYSSFAHAVGVASDGSKLQLKAGSSPWTGTLTTRLQIKAPEGPFTIGTP